MSYVKEQKPTTFSEHRKNYLRAKLALMKSDAKKLNDGIIRQNFLAETIRISLEIAQVGCRHGS